MAEAGAVGGLDGVAAAVAAGLAAEASGAAGREASAGGAWAASRSLRRSLVQPVRARAKARTMASEGTKIRMDN